MSETNSGHDNAASRLYDVMVRLRAGTPDERAIERVAVAFGTQPDRPRLLMQRMVYVTNLVHETRRLVSNLDQDAPDLVLKHFDQVEAVVDRFPYVGNVHMDWFLAGLTDAGMYSLELCASLLSRRMPEPTLVDRPSLLAQVRDLIDEVRAATDLDDGTRRFILDLLLKIERALEDYEYLGIRAVESAVNETVGALRRHPGIIARLANSKVIVNFGKFIIALDLALNMAANVKALEPAPEPTPSPVVQEIIQQCGVQLELPPAPMPPSVLVSPAPVGPPPVLVSPAPLGQ